MQLKASDSLVKIVSELKRVDAIVLCEGSRDAEAFKLVAGKLAEWVLGKGVGIAVTDAEGLNTLRRDVLPAALALIVGKVISRPKPVAIVVDANEHTPEERVRSLLDSLAARGYQAKTRVRQICRQVWGLQLTREPGEEIPILVAVNGVFNRPELSRLKKHTIEDHIAYLKLLESHITPEEAAKATNPKQLVGDNDLALIKTASTDHVRQAFSHMDCLLQALATHLGKHAENTCPSTRH